MDVFFPEQWWLDLRSQVSGGGCLHFLPPVRQVVMASSLAEEAWVEQRSIDPLHPSSSFSSCSFLKAHCSFLAYSSSNGSKWRGGLKGPVWAAPEVSPGKWCWRDPAHVWYRWGSRGCWRTSWFSPWELTKSGQIKSSCSPPFHWLSLTLSLFNVWSFLWLLSLQKMRKIPKSQQIEPFTP